MQRTFAVRRNDFPEASRSFPTRTPTPPRPLQANPAIAVVRAAVRVAPVALQLNRLLLKEKQGFLLLIAAAGREGAAQGVGPLGGKVDTECASSQLASAGTLNGLSILPKDSHETKTTVSTSFTVDDKFPALDGGILCQMILDLLVGRREGNVAHIKVDGSLLAGEESCALRSVV